MLETLRTTNSDHLAIFAALIVAGTVAVLYRLGYLRINTPAAAVKPSPLIDELRQIKAMLLSGTPETVAAQQAVSLSLPEPASAQTLVDRHKANKAAIDKRLQQINDEAEILKSASAAT